tara:strand:- start:222 stop:383 length:162 start_codon:yes stop_codon:yes gene_type:complete
MGKPITTGSKPIFLRVWMIAMTKHFQILCRNVGVIRTNRQKGWPDNKANLLKM